MEIYLKMNFKVAKIFFFSTSNDFYGDFSLFSQFKIEVFTKIYYFVQVAIKFFNYRDVLEKKNL